MKYGTLVSLTLMVLTLTTRQLNNKNVVTFCGVAIIDKQLHIVSEFCDEGSLQSVRINFYIALHLLTSFSTWKRTKV